MDVYPCKWPCVRDILFQYDRLSFCLSVILHFPYNLCICLLVCLSIFPTVRELIRMYLRQYVFPSIRTSVCPSVHLPVRLFFFVLGSVCSIDHLSFCTAVYLSIYVFFHLTTSTQTRHCSAKKQNKKNKMHILYTNIPFIRDTFTTKIPCNSLKSMIWIKFFVVFFCKKLSFLFNV